MSDQIIASDATIRETLGSLLHPEEYVRRILEKMYECRSHRGSASVRIGVTGEGRAPNYRTEYLLDGVRKVFAVYSGLSHEQREDLGELTLDNLFGDERMPDHALQGEHWSTRAMELGEVTALIGEIRGVKR